MVNSSSHSAQKRGAHVAPSSAWKRATVATVVTASLVCVGAAGMVPVFAATAIFKPAASSSSTSVNLGSAASYAVLAAAAVTAPGATITGNVAAGAALTTPGTHIISGSLTPSDADAARLSLVSTYTALKALPATELAGADLGGLTLKAGVYHSAAALAMTTPLTLTGDATSVFVFQSDAAMNTTAGVAMVLNGVLPSNIYWVTTGAATLGASSVLDGTILANAAVTVGASATVIGRALSVTAAVTLGASDTITIPVDPTPTGATSQATSTPTVIAAPPVALGDEGSFSVLASAAVTAPGSIINGSVGAGAALTAPAAVITGATQPDNTTVALASLAKTYANLKALTPNATLSGDDLGGLTLTAGVYHRVAALAVTSNLTFSGNANSVFVIQSDAAMNTTAGVTMTLNGGVLASNIYWVPTGAATLGASSVFAGNIVAGAAVTVGASSTVNGRALSVTAAVTLGASVIINSPIVVSSVPPVAPVTVPQTDVNLGTARNYSIVAGAAVTAPGSTIARAVTAGAALTAPGTTIVSSTGNDDTAARGGLAATYATLSTLKTTGTLPGDDLGGLTIKAGVYHRVAAIAVTSNLTFDGDANSVFVIQSDAAINTTAGIKIILLNGVQAANIYWVSAGATTLGASTIFAGTILANAAVTVGASSIITGRALSATAAVTLGATVTIIEPTLSNQ
jgi:hypothetical protein